MGFFDFLKVDPTISDPVVAQASGISKDENGIIRQKRTASSDRLARNLVPIAGMALTPALQGAFIPSVEYSPIASKMLPQGTNAVSRGVTYLGGKTQPLLGVSKSLPAVVNTETSLAPVSSTLSNSNFAKGVAGTLALGTAVGSGLSEPSSKKRVTLKQHPKYAIGKYNQKSYKRLVELQKQYGGDLIRQKDGSYFLRNKNGSFYGNGRALNAKTGKMQNYDLWGSGHFINNASKQEKPTDDVISKVTDKNYLYGYKGKPSQPRINNSAEGQRIMAWQKRLGVKADGWWGKNTAAAYNAYIAKQNPNKPGQTLQQATQSINPKPIQATPGYGIHVGNNGVTLQTPNGQTTDITNSHNVSALINNGNYKAPSIGPTNQLEQTASNLISPNQHQFSRGETRDFMRQQGLVNPSDYSASERRAFRHSINNDTGDWSGASRIMSDARLNNKLRLASGIDEHTQLEKPQVPSTLNNNLVSLKFKQGGQMYKYQQGGQAQQGIEQQAVALVQAAMQGDKQATQTIQQIMQAAQQGDQQATQVAQLLQAVMQKMKGSRKARLGAKLDYFKQTSECPEGQEVVYFKKGGEICKVCQGRKMQNGGKSNPVSDFKKKREQEQLKKNYQRNPATRGKSAKEIAEMQKRNRQEASQGKGESPANVAPWQYKKK